MGLDMYATTAKEAANERNQETTQMMEGKSGLLDDRGEAAKRLPVNRILAGDCIPVMQGFPDACIDLVVTDPPYLVRYRDRKGCNVHNDDRADWVGPAFRQIHRVLKPDAFCVSFYGWPHVETFMTAWKQAGFRPVGHMVWHKDYASRTGFLQARHEQAYLLAKGSPSRPDRPLSDVQPCTYTGTIQPRRPSRSSSP